MINANELRIGNWVTDDENLPCQVSGLRSEKLEKWEQDDLEILVEFANDNAIYSTKVINPIPLSPEVLEACGFINPVFDDPRGRHWCVPNGDPSKAFEICVWSDHVSYTMSNNFHRKIEFLHQLQNLYFALTGQELEVTL